MARQTGILPLSGKLGDKIYYFRRDKYGRINYFVRSAPDEVKQTAATKSTAADFGTASHCAKLLRDALQGYTQLFDSGTLINSLNKAMGRVVRADDSHRPGQRRVLVKNMHLLEGFCFNHGRGIDKLINETPLIERNNNQVSISLPEISFSRSRAFKGVTHLSIRAIALSVNFADYTSRQIASEAVVIQRNEKRHITFTLNTDSKDITCILLQVQSYYEVNGQLHLSRNNAASALDLISVQVPASVPAIRSTKKKQNKMPAFWLVPKVQRIQRVLPRGYVKGLVIADPPALE